MSILDQMRKNKSMSGLLDSIEQQTDKASKTKNYVDDRVWKLTRDKAGNGAALIRFLQAPPGSKNPYYVTQYDHSFAVLGGKVVDGKTPGARWYIEKSLSSLEDETGKQNIHQDYLAEQNQLLWQTGIKEHQDIARSRSRRTNYYCNILVINDPAHPENNGKVFLWRFPKTVLGMIKEQIQPLDDEFGEQKTPVNPFDIDEGANFKLKMRIGENGHPSYDKCEFQKPSVLCDGDEDEMNRVLESLYSIDDINSPKNFKTYEELKKRFLFVMGENPSIGTAESNSAPKVEPKLDVLEDEDVPDFSPEPEVKPKPKPSKPMPTFDDDDDDDMEFFKQLAE